MLIVSEDTNSRVYNRMAATAVSHHESHAASCNDYTHYIPPTSNNQSRPASLHYASVLGRDDEYADQRNEYANQQDLVDGVIMYSQLAAAGYDNRDDDDDDANAVVDNIYYNA